MALSSSFGWFGHVSSCLIFVTDATDGVFLSKYVPFVEEKFSYKLCVSGFPHHHEQLCYRLQGLLFEGVFKLARFCHSQCLQCLGQVMSPYHSDQMS